MLRSFLVAFAVRCSVDVPPASQSAATPQQAQEPARQQQSETQPVQSEAGEEVGEPVRFADDDPNYRPPVATDIGGQVAEYNRVKVGAAGSAGGAVQAAEAFVRKHLKYPHDATFPFFSHDTSEAEGYWIVKGLVKAKNGFGAELAYDYSAFVRLNGSQWECTLLSINNEIVVDTVFREVAARAADNERKAQIEAAAKKQAELDAKIEAQRAERKAKWEAEAPERARKQAVAKLYKITELHRIRKTRARDVADLDAIIADPPNDELKAQAEQLRAKLVRKP